MSTPLTPDEEFDAHFRRGLEHYPEQPEDPAAWQRMDQLLDGQQHRQQLRRRIWHLLSGEAAFLLLGIWLVVHWAASYPAASASRPAAGTPIISTTRTKNQRNPLSISSTTAPRQAPQAPGVLEATSPLGAVTKPLGAVTIASKATSTGRARAVAPTPSASSAAPVAIAQAAAGPRQLASGSARPATGPTNLLAATQWRTLPLVRPAKATRQSAAARAARRGAAATLANQALVSTSALAASTGRHSAQRRYSAGRDGVVSSRNQAPRAMLPSAGEVVGGVVSSRNRASKLSGQLAQATRRQLALRRGATPAAGQPSYAPLALATATPAGRRGPAGALDSLAARYPAREGNPLPGLPDSLAGLALAKWPQPADSLRPVAAWPAYRLQVGLVAAPELNSVRASRPTAPGGDVGLQADYQLARRWHLNVSYLQTLKRYAASGTDYHLPAGYATPHNWTISDVDAVCRIIDVPLNLRYDALLRPSYRLFASAGLSSLFMRREQYTYNYEPVNGKTFQPTDWTITNGANHYLKILNLSVGYERAINSRWSVQAEPYLKLPLGGVGYGQVRLLSAGVFFSFRYGLLPARPAAPAAR